MPTTHIKIDMSFLFAKEEFILMNYYSNKNVSGNYFLLPNKIFLLGLTAAEIAVYAYLIRCEDRETFTCYPSFNTIGKATNLCKSTVSKCVKSLEEKNLIFTEQTSIITKSGKKKNGNLRYTIRPISEAVDSFNRRKLREMEMELRKKFSETSHSLPYCKVAG